jgi:short-subunit dehydrogenase
VLPLMRRQKQGQIVNISSLSGFAPTLFMGMYSASKCAVEGHTEALRMELKPLNIHVSQIEPGLLESPMMMDKRQVVAERIAETVSKILASSGPRLRYLVGGQAPFVSRLKRFFPERAFETGVQSIFKLDRDA